jgi:hypothetical protein
MEILGGTVLGSLLLWFVVYTAVRGAIGDLRPAAPAFRLTWAGGNERGELHVENAGRAPVFDVVVQGPGASPAPLTRALLLHPGERLRVAVGKDELGEGERVDAHERVVHLALRHRLTLVPLGAEIKSLVPVRIPVAGTVPRTFG